MNAWCWLGSAREPPDEQEREALAVRTKQMERRRRGVGRAANDRHGQERLHARPAILGSGMEPAEVTDALEPGGQDVLEEPVEERVRRQRAGLVQTGVRLGIEARG